MDGLNFFILKFSLPDLFFSNGNFSINFDLDNRETVLNNSHHPKIKSLDIHGDGWICSYEDYRLRVFSTLEDAKESLKCILIDELDRTLEL